MTWNHGKCWTCNEYHDGKCIQSDIDSDDKDWEELTTKESEDRCEVCVHHKCYEQGCLGPGWYCNFWYTYI